ncbi:MAG: efflux RND transporter periplasmic adaptor subunit [Chryseolinea sp.]
MKNNKLISALTWSLVIACALAIESCTDGKSAVKIIPKSYESIPVRVAALEKSGRASVIKSSGRITTEDESVLGFKTGGVINAVLVKEGDAVKKGQLLATLDLTEINALVAQARIGFEKAQRDFQRAANLYRDSVATLEQFQNAETAVAIAKQQLEAAGFNKNFSEIHAPANGFVLRKFANAGQVVSIGDPIVMTNAASNGNWILKVGVSDKQWASINIKDKAKVMIDAFPDREFEAEVSRKSETSDAASGAFAIEVRIQNRQMKLANGMFGAATIETGTDASSWSVPYEAVLDANGNQGFVFVTLDEKIALKRPVTIEGFNGKTVRISSGLDDAKSLIVSGSAYLTDSSSIRIVK